MAPDHAPDEFQWVPAHAECTAAVMFERLRAGVKQDVERRNALERLDDGSRFEFSEDGEAFDVARLEASRFTDPKTVALVRFELVASVASVTLSVMPDGAPGRARSGYFGG